MFSISLQKVFKVGNILLVYLMIFGPAEALCVEEDIIVKEVIDEDKISEDELPNFTYTNVKTKEGLIFQVPADMPIVKRNNIVAPLPFDEYVYRKIKGVQLRMDDLEARHTELIQNLTARIEKLEEKKVVSQ